MTYDPSTDPALVADHDLSDERPCSGSLVQPSRNQIDWARRNLEWFLQRADPAKSPASVVDEVTIRSLRSTLERGQYTTHAAELARSGLAAIAARNEWHAGSPRSTP